MIPYCKPIIYLLIFFAGISGGQTVIAEETSPIVAFTHWPPMKVIKGDSFTPTYIAISKKSKFIDVIPRLGVALKNMVESKRIEEIEQTYIKKFNVN